MPNGLGRTECVVPFFEVYLDLGRAHKAITEARRLIPVFCITDKSLDLCSNLSRQVIELTTVNTAADIWSLGCLVIEMLTGYPPYFDCQPIQALYKIVQDESPPIPEGISPLLDDFLTECFQKVCTRTLGTRSSLLNELLY